MDQLKDLGVTFVLTGHSERRHVLHETPELISKKAQKIYGAGMTLIHCVGERLEERDSGKTLAVCEAQLKELKPSEISDPRRLVIAYEPVWAIGTGKTATPEQAQEAHAFIRSLLQVPVLYGGSVKPENAAELLSQPDVDGALVGGASLDVDSFDAICQAAPLP